MKQLAFISLALAALTACGQSLPKPQFTPGAIRTQDATDICSPTFRPAAFKKTTDVTRKKVCKEYGSLRCIHEQVHELIPYELGGADDIKNLWIQPAASYHEKKKLEDRLHDLVCSGQMQLPTAQQCLEKNWVECYDGVFHSKPK